MLVSARVSRANFVHPAGPRQKTASGHRILSRFSIDLRDKCSRVDAAETRPAGRVLEHEQKTNPAAVQRALTSTGVPTGGQCLLRGIDTKRNPRTQGRTRRTPNVPCFQVLSNRTWMKFNAAARTGRTRRPFCPKHDRAASAVLLGDACTNCAALKIKIKCLKGQQRRQRPRWHMAIDPTL